MALRLVTAEDARDTPIIEKGPSQRIFIPLFVMCGRCGIPCGRTDNPGPPPLRCDGCMLKIVRPLGEG